MHSVLITPIGHDRVTWADNLGKHDVCYDINSRFICYDAGHIICRFSLVWNSVLGFEFQEVSIHPSYQDYARVIPQQDENVWPEFFVSFPHGKPWIMLKPLKSPGRPPCLFYAPEETRKAFQADLLFKTGACWYDWSCACKEDAFGAVSDLIFSLGSPLLHES